MTDAMPVTVWRGQVWRVREWSTAPDGTVTLVLDGPLPHSPAWYLNGAAAAVAKP